MSDGLNTTITIYPVTATSTGKGGETTVRGTGVTVRAQRDTMNVREQEFQRRNGVEATHEFFVLMAGLSMTPTERYEIVEDGVTYDVQGVYKEDIKPGHRLNHYRIIALEVRR